MRVTPSRLVCQQAVELMSDYLDGALSRHDRRRLEKHLAECDACTAFLEQMRATIAASGVATPDDLSPEALNTLTQLFERYREPE
ncbi:MAG: anti-sigma factor [Acidimicrobiaceae bacterium]|nr:anti-sigma factor [Acidimicrobiaceae bacterium]